MIYEQIRVKESYELSLFDGYIRNSPCLVLSDHEDPHDEILVGISSGKCGFTTLRKFQY